MKKTFKFILILILVFQLLITSAFISKPQIGSDIGDLFESNNIVSINGYIIPVYSIDKISVISTSDLNKYGFDVIWIANKRETKISIGTNKPVTPLPVMNKMNSNYTPQKIADVIFSDIKASINNQQISCYIVNNNSYINLNDLQKFNGVKIESSGNKVNLTFPSTALKVNQKVIDEHYDQFEQFSEINSGTSFLSNETKSKINILIEKLKIRPISIIDNRVYYTIHSGYFGWNKTLYSIDLDGTNKNKIASNVFIVIKIDKDWTYYISDYYKLVKVKSTGDISTELCNTTSVSHPPIIYNNFIYSVSESNQPYLWRISVDGTEYMKIPTNKTPVSLKVIDNNIFYTYQIDEKFENNKLLEEAKYGLYQMNLDGSGEKLVTDDMGTSYFILVGNLLYYSDRTNNNRITQIDLNNYNYKKLLINQTTQLPRFDFSNNISSYYFDACDEPMLIIGDDLYFDKLTWRNDIEGGNVGVKPVHSIYKVAIKGGNSKLLAYDVSPNIITPFFVINDGWIYYADDKDGDIYKIRTDGTNKTKIINSINTVDIRICSDWVFYNNQWDSDNSYAINKNSINANKPLILAK